MNDESYINSYLKQKTQNNTSNILWLSSDRMSHITQVIIKQFNTHLSNSE